MNLQKYKKIMKKRLGFVSNSSSSSFIIGIARVTDEKKFRKFLDSNGIEDIEINTVKNLLKTYDFRVKDNKIYLESFMTDVNTEFESMNDKIAYYDFMGGDDSDFWDGDYYNYDIDLSFFTSVERKVYNQFIKKNIGIENGSALYGAGRNG